VKIPVLILFFTIVMAMIGSHFHLSRPFMSFLALSNFRTSWLSREITFTLVFFLLTAALLSRLWLSEEGHRIVTILGWAAVTFGLVTVWCMAFIYLLPTQVAWNSAATLFSYYGTTLLLGVISLFVILLMDIRFSANYDKALAEKKAAVVKRSLLGFVIVAVVAAVWVAGANLHQISLLRGIDHESAQTSLRLLLGLYRPLLYLRFLLLVLGLGCFVICSLRTLLKKRALNDMIVPVYVACLFVMIGEILERFLFYATHVRIGL
jgi:anaerobic dimethyl sulfoxide reductase subunit C (anchor subunit)